MLAGQKFPFLKLQIFETLMKHLLQKNALYRIFYLASMTFKIVLFFIVVSLIMTKEIMTN